MAVIFDPWTSITEFWSEPPRPSSTRAALIVIGPPPPRPPWPRPAVWPTGVVCAPDAASAMAAHEQAAATTTERTLMTSLHGEVNGERSLYRVRRANSRA